MSETAPEPATEPTPRSAKANRNPQLPVRPPKAYLDALKALSQRTGRTLTREVLMALDAHFVEHEMPALGQVSTMGRPRAKPDA